MMKFYSLRSFLFLFLFSVLIFSQLSCKKKEQALVSTDLKVNVRFFTNNYYADRYYDYSKYYETDSAAGANATVMLFRSLVDLEARVRPVATGKADGNGDLILRGIEPFAYFIYVSFDDTINYYDNSIGNNYLGDAMVEGGITGVSIPIYKMRPSKPQKIAMNYIEVIRYDTVSSGCSNDLKFVLYDDFDNPLDSTSDSKFCPTSATTSENAQKFYFGNGDYQTYPYADSLYDISKFGIDDYFKITLNESTDDGITFNTISSAYKYPSDFAKDNPYNIIPYPNRIRLWEDEHKIIYINWVWQ